MTQAKSAKTKPSLQAKLQSLEAQLKRALADYQNLEKRFAKESKEVIKFANAALLTKLLDLKDNLERAVSALQDKGLNLVLAQLEKILKEEGVVEIKALAQKFNPATMEAESLVKGQKDIVVSVVRKGYLLHDRVLRPAKVQVGSGHESKKSKKTDH